LERMPRLISHVLAVRDIGPRGGGAIVAGISPEDVYAFCRAGWSFVPAHEADELRRRGVAAARVYAREFGQILLSDGTMGVKFSDQLPTPVAQGRLERAGFFVRQRFPISKNYFRVRAPESDNLEASVQALTSMEGVEFAEPEFMEHIGPR
jgi:hypothetical protein